MYNKPVKLKRSEVSSSYPLRRTDGRFSRADCLLGCSARCEGCISRVSASCAQPLLARRLLPWTRSRAVQLRLRVQGNSSSGSEFAVVWISFSCIYVVARAPSICRLASANDCQRVSNRQPSEPCDGCALPKGTGTPLPGEGRNVARSERIYCTPETNATMNSGMLRARRRYCRVIRACAMHTHDGEVESNGYEQPAQLERHPDIRAWCLHTVPGATTILVRNLCGTPSAA